MTKTEAVICWSDAGHILKLMQYLADYMGRQIHTNKDYYQGYCDGISKAIKEIYGPGIGLVTKIDSKERPYIVLIDKKDNHELAGTKYYV